MIPRRPAVRESDGPSYQERLRPPEARVIMMHDLVTLADELKGNALPLHLSPERWNSFTTKTPLKWASVHWKREQKRKVPGVRGIYAFTVEFAIRLSQGTDIFSTSALRVIDAARVPCGRDLEATLLHARRTRGEPGWDMFLTSGGSISSFSLLRFLTRDSA